MTIKTKTKSYPKVTHPGTNNFYGAINVVYDSNLESANVKGFTQVIHKSV